MSESSADPARAETGLADWADALRVRQWVKNLLVLLPLLTSHRLGEGALLIAGLTAFLAFCLAASAVYVLNDLVDLAADRAHPRKRSRPFASGRLSPAAGRVAAPLLGSGAIGLSLAFLPLAFTALLALYLAFNVSYTLGLKHRLFVDVVLLAALYTLRVVAGGVAVDVPASAWLLGFSLFLFLDLALVKRYADLRLLARDGHGGAPGRAYSAEDAPVLLGLGAASGYTALVVFALYIQSDAVRPLYATPGLLWLAVPLLAYWIGRLWLLAHRGVVADDPLAFSLRDRASYAVGIAGLAVLAAATLLGSPGT